MKKIIVITVALITVASFIMIQRSGKTSDQPPFTIGILQTASHPALDAVRDGFIEELKKRLDGKVAFVLQNAQGSAASMQTIAQRFHADKSINAIFAIATPAAQAASAVEQNKPIIFAAVTDPQALGFIHATTNISGASDMINVPSTIDMIVALAPTAKKFGLLFNSGEANSVGLIKLFKQELEQRGLQAVEFGVTSEADLAQAAQTASRNTDALLAPTDNTIASAIQLVASVAQANKKPLFVSDNLLVSQGALAARGVDYKENGKQAADIAYKIVIEGKKPSEVLVAQQTNSKIVVNKTLVETLGLTIPESLKPQITMVDQPKG